MPAVLVQCFLVASRINVRRDRRYGFGAGGNAFNQARLKT
jgi:hypothetical protein